MLTALHRFCAYVKQDHRRLMANLDANWLGSFYDWCLNQNTGKNGRRKCGIKSTSSLKTYWKQFRLVYQRAMGCKLDATMTRKVHRVREKAWPFVRSGLTNRAESDSARTGQTLRAAQSSSREVPYVCGGSQSDTSHQHLHDEEEISTWQASHADATVSAAGRIHGESTCGSSRTALQTYPGYVAQRSRRRPGQAFARVLARIHQRLSRDQRCVRAVPTVDTRARAHDADVIDCRVTFPIPEVVYDPTLTFSPHVILGGIMFEDQAFAASELSTPEKLSSLEIEPGYNQLPLPLKPEMADVSIFRQAVRTFAGWTISDREPMTYAILRASLKQLGQITGFSQVTRPYVLRYGAGKAFNENGQSHACSV